MDKHRFFQIEFPLEILSYTHDYRFSLHTINFIANFSKFVFIGMMRNKFNYGCQARPARTRPIFIPVTLN